MNLALPVAVPAGARYTNTQPMALIDLTKQLAQQAILSASQDPPAAPAQPPPDNTGSMILGQIQAMQKALKEDEELLVWFENGTEKIRVLEIFMPSWRLA